MYLYENERKDILKAYELTDFSELDHYQVGPDCWLYLFEAQGKNYALISSDYLGYFEFDSFPQILEFDDPDYKTLKLSVKAERPLNEALANKKAENTILFEY